MSSAFAGDPPCAPEHTHQRAGCSDQIAPWAKPANTDKYAGGYIGGGCLWRGEGRDPVADGTWGWDFVGGGCRPGRFFLGWCHENCRKAKTGTYRTEGRPLPDLFASPPGT